MWSRRKEEEYTPRQSDNSPSPASVSSKEGIPMSTSMPSRNVEPEPFRPSAAAASIGKSVSIKGQIMSREDLYLDGQFEGTVELQEHRLTIGPHHHHQSLQHRGDLGHLRIHLVPERADTDA